jgi:hypothetical protein
MLCAECGSDALVPSERRITIDRGEVFEAPVPAVQCKECGKMFADPKVLAAANTPTLAPPPDER